MLRLVRQEALEQAAPVGLVVLFEREAELAQDLQQEFPRTDVLALDRGDDDALVEIAAAAGGSAGSCRNRDRQ